MTDLTGARRPSRAPLAGERVRLEPLTAEHARDLFGAAQGDPALWRYLPYGPFPDAEAYAAWIAADASGDDPLFYAILGEVPLGVASYLRIHPEHGSIEIGHIWFGAGMQRTPAGTEAIYLLAREAFDGLGNRRLEWKCDAANARSRRAAERFGFTFEGVFRQHMIVKGRNRDTAWYSIVDGEWPRVRAAFEAWLAPENFDGDGAQQRGLAEIRAAL